MIYLTELFQKVLYGHVLPRLVDSCLCPETILLSLPALIALIDHVTPQDYKTVILPQFRRILSSPKPMQVSSECLKSITKAELPIVRPSPSNFLEILMFLLGPIFIK